MRPENYRLNPAATDTHALGKLYKSGQVKTSGPGDSVSILNLHSSPSFALGQASFFPSSRESYKPAGTCVSGPPEAEEGNGILNAPHRGLHPHRHGKLQVQAPHEGSRESSLVMSALGSHPRAKNFLLSQPLFRALGKSKCFYHTMRMRQGQRQQTPAPVGGGCRLPNELISTWEILGRGPGGVVLLSSSNW